jgi:hypothetical protein
MSESVRRPPGHTDVAALCGAAIAVPLSIFLAPGPFDPMGVVVAMTLGLVIFGYIWKHERTLTQSAAVAALLGLMAIPIVGFFAELFYAHDRWSLLTHGDPLNCFRDATSQSCESHRSEVSNLWQIGTWSIGGLVCFLVDRKMQGARGAARPEQGDR